MKKIFSIFISSVLMGLFSFSALHSQPWMDKLDKNQAHNFYAVKLAFNDYWKDKDFKERSNGWKPFKRWEWYWEQRVAPTGEFPNPMQLYKEKVLAFKKLEKQNRNNNTIQDNTWSIIGPSTSSGGYAGLGRLNCVRVDPNYTNIIWVGAASGGLWKSTDGGGSWNTNTDELASIGITDIIINPSNSNIMYIATGDGDHSDTYSVGVLKSTNGGLSWSSTGLDWSTSQVRTISRLLMNPNDVNMIYAASTNGIYKTTNAGSSWDQVSTVAFKDMEFKPNEANTIYAAGTQVYRTTDAGLNWASLSNGIPTADNQRIALAVSPANASYVYAVISNSGSALRGVYRSTDGGDTWALRASTPNILAHTQDGSGTTGQGWYDLCMAVSQTNSEEVYVGGVNVWKSTNGGQTWRISTMWYSSGSTPVIHADQHDLWFIPGTSTLYSGNDGGIYRTNNGGTSWTWLGSGLKITQFYRFGTSVTNSNILIGGTQDNGTKLKKTNSWSDVLGGDGMECLVDYTNENIIFGELYYGDIYRSTDGGNNFTGIKGSISETGGWITPFVMHPTNHSILFAGYDNLWKTTNSGSSWTKLTSFTENKKLSIIAIAPSDPNYLYVGNGTDFKLSTNGGSAWSVITMPSTNTLTYVAVNPNYPLRIWATFSGYTAGSKVFKSTDGGLNWTNISGTLPNVPVNTITYQKNSADRIFIGTDIGVYYLDNTVSDWQDYNIGLPNVEITELEFHYCSSKLRASTYGRGIWEATSPDALTAPQAQAPTNNSLGQAINNLTIMWNAVNYASSYRIQVSKQSDFSTLILDSSIISSASVILNNLDYYTQYYWRVKASGDCCASGWSNNFSFMTLLGAPILAGPAKGSGGLPINGDLNWNAVIGAESYRVQVATDANFNNVIFNRSGITSLKASYVNLNYYTHYYWHVNASNSRGTGDWSEVWDFVTVLAPPVLKKPDNLATCIPMNGTLQWNAVTGATNYTLQISGKSDFSSLTYELKGITSTSTTFAGLNYYSIYYWRVNASNESGTSDWSEVREFLTILQSPTLTGPPDLMTGLQINGTLTWSSITGAQTYHIQISKYSNFTSNIVDIQNVTTQFDYEKLEYYTKYYWRVSANISSCQSQWSDVCEFTTELKPPILVSPSNHTQKVESSVKLTWQPVPGAENYTIQVSLQPEFIVFEKNVPSFTGTSYQLTGLDVNRKFYWRVHANGNKGGGKWSETWDFSTKLPMPELVSPANYSTKVPLNGALVWKSLANIDSFLVQLSTDKNFGSFVINQSVSNANKLDYSKLDNYTKYFWRVNATSVSGTSDWSAIGEFTTLIGTLELISPPDKSVNVPVIGNVSWKELKGAESYHYQISAVNDFYSPFVDKSGIIEPTQQYTQLNYNTHYYWRAAAKSYGVYLPWTNVWEFTTTIRFPQLLLPLNHTEDVPLYGRMIWSEVDGADSYHLQVSKTSDFSSPSIDNLNITKNLYDYSGLELNTMFYWRVRASNKNGNSDWSEIWDLRIERTSDVHDNTKNQNNYKVAISPNPFSGSTLININMSKNECVKIKIFDLYGNLIQEIADKSLQPGDNYYNWQPLNLSSGVYYCQVSVGVSLEMFKLILMQ